MTSNPRPGPRILGSLRSAGGKGVVRIEDRYGTGIDDLWQALTDPDRLASWYGQVEGDLRPGGQFRLHVEDADSDATGGVEACEPPQRLQVMTRETEESYRRGNGVAPYDEALDATLTADGDQTTSASHSGAFVVGWWTWPGPGIECALSAWGSAPFPVLTPGDPLVLGQMQGSPRDTIMRADANGRDRSSDLAEQLLQPAGYLSVPADRDQMHPVECARVTELDDLIAGCLDAREAICPHPFAKVGGNVDVGDYRCHPLGVRLAGQDHHAGEDRDLDRVGVPPPHQCVNREADLCEQEVCGLLPGRQGTQGRSGPYPELCHPGEGLVCGERADLLDHRPH